MKPTAEAANNLFSMGALCTYQINFPDDSDEGDVLQVSLESMYKTNIKYMVGVNYASNDY